MSQQTSFSVKLNVKWQEKRVCLSWWRGVQWIMHSIKHINIWPLTLWSHNRDGTKNDVQVQMLLWYLYFFVIGWDFVIDMLVIKTHLIAVMCIQIINLQKHNFKWSNSSHYLFSICSNILKYEYMPKFNGIGRDYL